MVEKNMRIKNRKIKDEEKFKKWSGINGAEKREDKGKNK